MVLRRLAGLALGLALPLTFVGAVSADYTDEQNALVDRFANLNFVDDEDGFDVKVPIAGGIFIIEDGSRRDGSDLYGDIEDFYIFGNDE